MDETPGFRPLYRQVYDYLVRQIATGVWRPAEALPSEQDLAGELGVSQGTVRKALDVLAAEKLVERRQGKGTYVAEQTQERALFRFFRWAYPGGQRAIPTSMGETVKRRSSTSDEQKKLHLRENAKVVEIGRMRLIDGKPAIAETIVVPAILFPDLDKRVPLPNTLYSLYQSAYGINIVAVEEEVRAELVRKDDAKKLRLTVGSPLLRIDRIAIALDGGRVELRVSRCSTRNLVYALTIR
jgi:GntR family transcriptional regulator